MVIRNNSALFDQLIASNDHLVDALAEMLAENRRLRVQNEHLIKALKGIEVMLLVVPWTEREQCIYSVACAALNLVEEGGDA